MNLNFVSHYLHDVRTLYRTRKQLQESPLRDEIKGGTVVTKQKVPEPSVANSNNGGGGSAHKKGAGRKF